MNHVDQIAFSSIQKAQRVIKASAIRTPLVRLNVQSTSAEIYLKLENLQPIGSFKIRGAANAIAQLSKEELALGVVTASAGNMAQGVAWCARDLGISCTVIAPEGAPETKIKSIERLGGQVIKVPFDEWWKAFSDRGYPGVAGTFIHAFDDPHVMAGNGTIGVEIIEDLPDADAVVVPWGGGGLACGIASAMRVIRPSCKVYAAEVSTAAPLTAAFRAGAPQAIDYQSSFVDGIGGKSVFPRMFARAKDLIDGVIVAELPEVSNAIRLMAQRNRIIAEGAGACPVACALAGKAGSGKVVCIVSGGNIDFRILCEILVQT